MIEGINNMLLRCVKYFFLYMTFPAIMQMTINTGFWWSGRALGWETVTGYYYFGTKCHGYTPDSIGPKEVAVSQKLKTSLDPLEIINLNIKKNAYINSMERDDTIMLSVATLQVLLAGMLGIFLYHYSSSRSGRRFRYINEAAIYLCCFLFLFPLSFFEELFFRFLPFGFSHIETILSKRITGNGWALHLILTGTSIGLLTTVNFRKYLLPLYVPVTILLGGVAGIFLWYMVVGKPVFLFIHHHF